MFQIVAFGPRGLAVRQLLAVIGLLEKYELPGFDVDGSIDTVHSAENDYDLVCFAVELDILVLCGSTPLPVRQFLAEAMRLPGVYEACPECVKRRYWEAKTVPLPASPAEG